MKLTLEVITSSLEEEKKMKKEMIQLTKGNMEIYDFGVLRLHAYQTINERS